MTARAAQRQAANVLKNRAKWPTLSKAAKLIQVHPSTLNKQVTEGRIRCVRLGLGRGTLHVPPVEVLRLAEVFGRTTVESVRTALAHEVAMASSFDEAAILQELVDMHNAPEEEELATLQPNGIGARSGNTAASNSEFQLSGSTPMHGVIKRTDRRSIPPLPAIKGDIPTLATVRNIQAGQPIPLEATVKKRGIKATRKVKIYPGMKF